MISSLQPSVLSRFCKNFGQNQSQSQVPLNPTYRFGSQPAILATDSGSTTGTELLNTDRFQRQAPTPIPHGFKRGGYCEDVRMVGNDLAGKVLEQLALKRAWLYRVDLSNANLKQALIQNSELSVVNLDNAQLHQSEWINTKMTPYVSLQNAQAPEAVFQNVDLSGADLSGINLRNARLKNVNFEGADLSDADLTGTELDQVNFNGANLSNAKLGVRSLKNTVLFPRTAEQTEQETVALRQQGYERHWNGREFQWRQGVPLDANQEE
ncbi:MAG: pentapeptide repeat-containing protein [Candidatus Melainabacteria bacterium]|nr:pentapeptide repeat-containing protein [Candidatus Melainabacteria bacterium]